MKKIILVLIPLILSTVSMAQINKGALLYEGTVAFYVNNSGSEYSQSISPQEQNYTQFSFSPKVGLFTSGTFLLGIGLSYEFQKSENTSSTFGPNQTSTTKSNVFLLNPYVRKYIKLGDKLFFTITGNSFAGFGKASNELKYDGNDLDTKSDILDLRLNVTPGLTYFLTNQWAITANFGQLFYTYRKQEFESSDFTIYQTKSTNHYFGGSLQFNTFGIGVQYIVRNKE
jgi:hypothetical protein